LDVKETDKNTAKTALDTLKGEVIALQTAYDAMPESNSDEQAAKTAKLGALNTKKGARDTAQGVFNTLEGNFDTAKSTWDAAEVTRIANEATAYEQDLNADY
jgi:hypothetical protein